MRRDVSKVISERPKSGRTWESKTPRTKTIDIDPLGEQINEAANHTIRKRQKLRATRFNVLERFLMHRVGRVWDRVYAEACLVADPRSFGGAEIRETLKSLVATECWLDGKTVKSYDCHGCAQVVKGFYVHPRSGLLLREE